MARLPKCTCARCARSSHYWRSRDAGGGRRGFLSLANVKTGVATKVNTMPGALPGEYDSAVIVGDTVFVQRYTNKSDWMIIQDGTLKPFLGGPNFDIDRFATDGKWIVTGHAWVSSLPQKYVWGGQSYPTATELWGAVTPDLYAPDKALTIARVPYADMTEIQTAMP